MSKITIIGVGHVGSHVASSLMHYGVCSEIALIDIDEKKCLSHSIDLSDMSAYLDDECNVYFGDYSDLKDSDILVVSTCGEMFTQDRLHELESTMETINNIIPKIISSGFNGIILSISNPCDLIAQHISNKTGLNVIGTGTMLDTARLRVRLSKALSVSSKSINAYVLGEHGDSQMAAYSIASVNGIPLFDYINQNNIEVNLDDIAKNTNEAGWDIVVGKGCTEFGIGIACATLAKAILRDEYQVLPCSIFLEEQGIYASVPCVVGRSGIISRVNITLNSDEQALFDKSCEVLRLNAKKLK